MTFDRKGKEVTPIQFDLKILLKRKEYRLAHDLACERLATPGLPIQEQAECNLIASYAAAFLGDEPDAVARGEAAYTTARIAAAEDASQYDLLGQAIITSSHAYNMAGLYAKALERIGEFELHSHQYTPVAQALDAVALFDRGVYYRNLGQTAAARECTQVAYELAAQRGLPETDKYRSTLVWLLLRQGDAAAALQVIEAGDRYDGADSEERIQHDLRQKMDRAYYFLQVGDTGEAFDLCLQALGADPAPDLRAVILHLLHELARGTDQTEEALGLAILAAQAAAEAGRRDLLTEAQESALALAQHLSPIKLEQILAQLRSITVT